MLSFYKQQLYFSQIVSKKDKITISFFIKKFQKITILFWVLVFSFMYLVSVDAKDRSHRSNFFEIKQAFVKICIEIAQVYNDFGCIRIRNEINDF